MPEDQPTIPTYRMEGDRVAQSFPDEQERFFDPSIFGRFQKDGTEVRAVRIPGPFRLGADHCVNGYLVFDGKLKAISAESFCREYQPIDQQRAA